MTGVQTCALPISENIKGEVRELKKQGYDAVYILDENFIIKKEHFDAVTQIMKEEEMKYRVEFRSSNVNESIAKKLKDTGCIYTAIGFESGDDEILKRVNKKTSVEKNRKAIEILGKYEIPVKGFFIIGLPGETEETARKTVAFSEEMKYKGLTSADFYSLTPFPGSPIWDDPEKYGIKILSRDFDSYLQKEDPVIETENLSRDKIKEIVEEGRNKWKKR